MLGQTLKLDFNNQTKNKFHINTIPKMSVLSVIVYIQQQIPEKVIFYLHCINPFTVHLSDLELLSYYLLSSQNLYQILKISFTRINARMGMPEKGLWQYSKITANCKIFDRHRKMHLLRFSSF